MNKFKLAIQINRALQFLTENLTEEQALEVPDLYPKWRENVNYFPNTIIKYGEIDDVTQLFVIIQEHVSQAEWKPDETPSLYKRIGFKEDGTPLWVQPLGSTDAYNIGDIVSHNGIIYISTHAANVWEPGIYGWEIKE